MDKNQAHTIDSHTPVVSVIVPVYNVEQYLRSCIDSILAQTFTDFELILVDDGSTDGSQMICDEYATKDSRVRVIHQENAGVSKARNTGIQASEGEYITFIDSDDWVASGFLDRMYTYVCNNNSSICIGRVLRVKRENDESPVYDDCIRTLESREAMNYLAGAFDERIRQCVAKLVRSEIVKKHFFPVNRQWSEDTAVVFRWYAEAQRITVTEDRLYKYYTRETSLTHSGLKARTDEFYTIQEMLRFFQDNGYTDLYRRYAVYYTKSMAVYYKKSLRMKHGEGDRIFCQKTFRNQLRKMMKYYQKVVPWKDRKIKYYVLAYIPGVRMGYWFYREAVGMISGH